MRSSHHHDASSKRCCHIFTGHSMHMTPEQRYTWCLPRLMTLRIGNLYLWKAVSCNAVGAQLLPYEARSGCKGSHWSGPCSFALTSRGDLSQLAAAASFSAYAHSVLVALF